MDYLLDHNRRKLASGAYFLDSTNDDAQQLFPGAYQQALISDLSICCRSVSSASFSVVQAFIGDTGQDDEHDHPDTYERRPSSATCSRDLLLQVLRILRVRLSLITHRILADKGIPSS